jgi:hypothetical protein
MDEKKLFRLVEQFARVDGVSPAASPPLVVHYMARPSHAGPQFNQMVENHSLVEVRVDEAPSEMLDSTLHEVQHYFFRDAPYRLGPAFAQSSSPSGLSAFNLLDESLATATQALVLSVLDSPTRLADRLARPRSLYEDDVNSWGFPRASTWASTENEPTLEVGQLEDVK